MKSKPTDAAAGLDNDYAKITHDMRAFALCEPTLPSEGGHETEGDDEENKNQHAKERVCSSESYCKLMN